MTGRKPWILAILALGGLVVFGVGAVWGAAGGSPAASPVPAATSCGSLELSELAGGVNTVLDKERGLLTLSFRDEQTKGYRSVTVRYEDSACLAIPSLRRLIQHVTDTDAQAQAQTCASMRDLVERNVTFVRGVRVNPAAGRKYLAEWC